MLKEVDTNEFNELCGEGVVLADFFSTTCGPCKMLSFVLNDVEKVLGVTGFEDMFKVLDSILNKQQDILLQSLDNIEKSGIDLKLFIKNFLQFVLDINKYIILKTECPNTLVQFTMIPPSYENRLQQYNVAHRQALKQLLQLLLQLNSLVRWETNVKPVLETNLLLEIL